MPNIEVEADPEQLVGSALAYDARGKPLGAFHVPGGRPPAGTVRVVMSDADYDEFQRHMSSRAH